MSIQVDELNKCGHSEGTIEDVVKGISFEYQSNKIAHQSQNEIMW